MAAEEVVAAEEVEDVELEFGERELEDIDNELEVVRPPDPISVLDLPICGGVINSTAPNEQTVPVPIIKARFTSSSFLFHLIVANT